MSDKWGEAMIELNSVLEEAKEAGVTKDEAIKEIYNVYGQD